MYIFIAVLSIYIYFFTFIYLYVNACLFIIISSYLSIHPIKQFCTTRCCREHDMGCDVSIQPGQTKFGLTNVRYKLLNNVWCRLINNVRYRLINNVWYRLLYNVRYRLINNVR